MIWIDHPAIVYSNFKWSLRRMKVLVKKKQAGVHHVGSKDRCPRSLTRPDIDACRTNNTNVYSYLFMDNYRFRSAT